MKRQSRKYVAVLGCGPAGLLAALAATRKGYGVDIYSRKIRSGLFGAQYLHAPIPDLSLDRPETVSYQLRGTADEYALKVYGDSEAVGPADVSPASLASSHPAWNLRSAYARLWETFEADIVHSNRITGKDVADLLGRRSYRRVISSIPMRDLCSNQQSHSFISQSIWASGDAPELDRWAPFRPEPWTVVCDGTEDVSWYRSSNVFGHATVEWAREDKPPVDNVSQVTKPIRTNCDCFKPMIRVGRYGIWRKGVLAHEAYDTVLEQL